MSDLLQRIADTASRRFTNRDTETDAEILAAATLAKTIAEANKAEVEAQNHAKQFALERLKSWSALLIPLVSLLTLTGTVVFQWIQLRAQTASAYRQSEDAEWRDLIASLRGPSGRYASDLTTPSRLQPFLDSDRYKIRARDLAIRLMATMTDQNAFVELYNTTSESGAEGELKRNIAIARGLTTTRLSLDNECLTEATVSQMPRQYPYGVCTFALTFEEAMQLAKMTSDPRAATQRRLALTAVLGQQSMISNNLAQLLRKRDASKEVDLSYLALVNADFSDVDFSFANLSNTSITFSKLDRAKLTPAKMEYLDLNDSEWWNSGSIDQGVLEWQLENRYPYHAPGISTYPSGKVSREFYEKRVIALCATQKPACKPPLKYSPPPEPGGTGSRVPGAPRRERIP